MMKFWPIRERCEFPGAANLTANIFILSAEIRIPAQNLQILPHTQGTFSEFREFSSKTKILKRLRHNMWELVLLLSETAVNFGADRETSSRQTLTTPST
jgi:hypothetical protein